MAIDRTTAQQHAIPVHKADAIQVSQLMLLRHISLNTTIDYISPNTPMEHSQSTRPALPIRCESDPVDQRGYSGSGKCAGYAACRGPVRGVTLAQQSQTFYLERPASLLSQDEELQLFESTESQAPDEDKDAKLPFDLNSNAREVRDFVHTRSDFPALETILRVQRADGKFPFVSSSFMSALRQKYGNALEELLNSKFNRESQATSFRLKGTLGAPSSKGTAVDQADDYRIVEGER